MVITIKKMQTQRVCIGCGVIGTPCTWLVAAEICNLEHDVNSLQMLNHMPAE